MKTLDDYQIVGAKFLAERKFAALGDDMGLGKTCQLIVASDMIWAENILVICPAAARINWFREYGEFSVNGNEGFKVCETNSELPSHKMIVSFDYARDNFAMLSQFCQWDVIIIDECHFIKEPEAKITRAIYGKKGLVRFTNRMWLSSGTIAPNHYGELWPMLFTFGRTALRYDDFIERYCHVKRTNFGGKYQTQIMGSKKDLAPELVEMLDGFQLRRQSDVLDNTENQLPPITFEDFFVEPTPVDLSMHPQTYEYSLGRPEGYVRKLEEMADKLDAIVESALETGETAYLEGVYDSVATLRRHNGLAKMPELIKKIQMELHNNEYQKIVIFAFHQDVIEGIREGLKHFGSVTLYGGTAAKKRQRNIDKFMTNPRCRVFVGNILAAGTAITLTSATEVLMAEWMFTPAPNQQAIKRVWRRTQSLPVRVRFASIANSIDEKISSVYKRKAAELAELDKLKGE